jgi:parallel beta-helix repeat protein
MQTLRFFLFSFIILTIISNAQTVIPPGDVSGTWAIGGSPYEIQGEIKVPDGLTLTIEPGVLVEFQGHYKLNVQGRLLAVGTETDTITFTINDTTGFHNPNIPDGGWAGIRFINVFSMIDSSNIIYCKIEYGKAIGYWPDGSGGAICVDGFDKLLISNCLITNNTASVIDGSGGGIALWNSNPRIIGNTISYNSALHGGGILCFESSPIIENSIIEYNTAIAGGGIVCNENSNPTITNTTIDNNTATDGAGGGIVCWYSSIPSLYNVTVSNNSAALWGGGGISVGDGDLQIDNCTFIDNEIINGLGGAINYHCGNTLNITYQINITNTVFTNNTGGSGGGIWAGSSDSAGVNVVIDKCEFANNFAGVGSGLRLIGKRLNFTLSNSIFTSNEATYIGAGATFAYNCAGTVINCLFASNNAGTGVDDNSGGVNIWSGAKVDFMNCTFADNSASYGAGLTVNGGGSAITTNCIFWGNSTDQIALDTLNGEGGTLTVNYCDIQDGENSVNVIDPLLSTLTWGTGNADDDPLFEDSGNGDYHLQDNSTCINAGIDEIQIGGVWYYSPPDDIEGNPRPNPSGSMPDIGAYESLLANPVSVEENEMIIPTGYALYQNFPNPFNPSTTIISYSVAELSFVTLKVYDVLGNEIVTLINEEMPVGSYNVEFKATQLPSGIYFYRLQAGSFVETKKMVLMK